MQITGIDVDATRLHCNSVLCAIGAVLGDYLRVETRKNLSPKVEKRSKRKVTCNVTIERKRFRLEYIEVRGKTQSRYEATMCRKKFVKLGRHGTRVTDYTVHRARCYHSFLFSLVPFLIADRRNSPSLSRLVLLLLLLLVLRQFAVSSIRSRSPRPRCRAVTSREPARKYSRTNLGTMFI